MIFEILGYFGALVIGISLGLIGGGGSILAVPVLAYFFGINATETTSYSLFIVGVSALVGGIKQNKLGNVDWKTAFIFGIPAIVGVFVVRHYIIPLLPEVLFVINHFEFTRRMGMFGLFAILMIPAALSMIKEKNDTQSTGEVKYNYPLIFIEGIVVGAITGFVGAGGGFLIIPALVLLANIDIKKAIGTSLIIIALKSIIGFTGDLGNIDINWIFLLTFTAIAIVGIFLGTYLTKFFNGKQLKKGFGYFIFLMAGLIFYLEFFFTHKS